LHDHKIKELLTLATKKVLDKIDGDFSSVSREERLVFVRIMNRSYSFLRDIRVCEALAEAREELKRKAMFEKMLVTSFLIISFVGLIVFSLITVLTDTNLIVSSIICFVIYEVAGAWVTYRVKGT